MQGTKYCPLYHLTKARGVKVACAKLNDELVKKIRREYKGYKELEREFNNQLKADEYGIHVKYYEHIIYNKVWIDKETIGSKLNWDIVNKMRKDYENFLDIKDDFKLKNKAAEYSISMNTYVNVTQYNTWVHVEDA